MNLPNFFIIGVQKAGTSTLHQYLSRHADFFMSQPKELHVLDRTVEPAEIRQQYARYFRRAGSKLFRGESTPLYLHYPGVAERIQACIPDAKLIVILRDPGDRAYSHYWHERKLGWENQSFEDALLCESQRIAKNDRCWQHYSYVSRGFYSLYAGRFMRLFGQEQMLFLDFEELKADPRNCIRRVLEFLGADAEFSTRIEPERVYASALPRSEFLGRIAGRLDQFMGDRNLGSRIIRRVNLTATQYSAMGDTAKDWLDDIFAGERRFYAQVCRREEVPVFEKPGMPGRLNPVQLPASLRRLGLELGAFHSYWCESVRSGMGPGL